MPESVESLSDRAVEMLARDPRVRLVFLFGSSARPGVVPPRDLDLALMAEPPFTTDELLRVQGHLQARLAVAVDLVDLSEASIALAHEIVEGGRCVFARTPDDETEVVTRTRMRWWDWLPMREVQWSESGRRLEKRLDASS